MEISKKELIDIVQTVVDTTITRLERRGVFVTAETVAKMGANANANTKQSAKTMVEDWRALRAKSAYQQTESLLYNYNNFLKIVREKEQEIEDLRKYGVPERGSAVVKYSGNCGGKPRGLVLDEERVEEAVRNVEKSMVDTVQALSFIDKGMDALKYDPYYKILEMRYFEGRTQEDMAVEFGCTQQNIAYHKSRLIKELSIKLFPDKVVNEFLK